jgi:hypothetical protein
MTIKISDKEQKKLVNDMLTTGAQNQSLKALSFQ